MLHTKFSMVQSHLCIIFDKVDGYIRKYDETKYLSLFHSGEKHERIFERIRSYYVEKHYSRRLFPKIKINAEYYLSLEKIIKTYNVVTLIKSFFIKTHIIVIKYFPKNAPYK